MEGCEMEELEPRLLGSTCNPDELTVTQQEEVVHTNYRKVRSQGKSVLGIRIRMFFEPPGSGSISQRYRSGFVSLPSMK
jgi:hypothetical protein